MSSIIPVFIPHVGCPHDCVFCNQRKIAGQMSAPSGEEVKKIIEAALLKIDGKASSVAFYGGSFTAIEKSLCREYLSVASEFVKQGRVDGIRFSTRPDCVDEEVMSLLSEYPVRTIELGAQSMVDRVLSASARGHTAEDTRRAARLIKERGYELILQMMVGLPDEKEGEELITAREIAALSPDGVRIYPVVVIRETKLESLWREEKYTPLSPEEAAVRGARLLDVFEEAKIPVIRFGLNPTDDLSGGEALAGAYHPALGEMAQAERYLARARERIKELPKAENIEIFVNPKKISQMSGQKRANKDRLKAEFSLKSISIKGDESLADGEVRVQNSY